MYKLPCWQQVDVSLSPLFYFSLLVLRNFQKVSNSVEFLRSRAQALPPVSWNFPLLNATQKPFYYIKFIILMFHSDGSTDGYTNFLMPNEALNYTIFKS